MPQYKDRKLPFSSHPQSRSVFKIVKTLQDQGYEALLAGGAVRDALLGVVPGDLDVATKAEPNQVESLFKNTVAVGKAFGVIRVIEEGHSIEVATYRLDQNYKDGRRPEAVVFTSREEDAKRRDFTINALYYDITHDVLYDDVDGLRDLDQKVLRAVGNPALRFQEDELRRLRLIRFVSQLGFDIEPETWKSVRSGVEGLRKISRERVTEEVQKMWKSEHLEKAFPLFMSSGLAENVDPIWKEVSVDKVPAYVWKWSRNSVEEAWAHYFGMQWVLGLNWEKFLYFYKISKDLQKKLVVASKVFKMGAGFLHLSWAQQRRIWTESLTEWALVAAFDVAGDAGLKTSFEEVRARLRAAGPLPEPLIRGADLLPRYQGPELGKMLEAIYMAQLNEDWTVRDQAIAWMKTQGWEI